jgi:hypothetical protein
MQAIETKYLGPTNFRGARIKASAEAGSITIPWDHALNAEDNHKAAALAFVNKWGWSGVWVLGHLPSGNRVATCAIRYGMSDDVRPSRVVDSYSRGDFESQPDAGRGILRSGVRVLTIKRDEHPTVAKRLQPHHADLVTRDIAHAMATGLIGGDL